ncbi:MAG: TIGR00730 family Rossman fold protein [Robiginitomaculum sp.]|nr:MAG: TIGR00730 family Rossman fold protein [Robiginitomaculum sp.]
MKAAKPAPKQQKKSICVFCGASKVVDEHYFTLAEDTGTNVANRGYRLVYGGGGIGLMGATALAAHNAGGDVLGIIPKFLTEIEDLLTEIDHRIVDDMHERKHQMYEESDAFLVLPGGIGTLEEAIEIISWMRLHLHTKPLVFLDTDGYWAPIMELLRHTIDAKFSPEWVRGHLFREETVKSALDLIEAQWANPAPKGEIQVSNVEDF